MSVCLTSASSLPLVEFLFKALLCVPGLLLICQIISDCNSLNHLEKQPNPEDVDHTNMSLSSICQEMTAVGPHSASCRIKAAGLKPGQKLENLHLLLRCCVSA